MTKLINSYITHDKLKLIATIGNCSIQIRLRMDDYRNMNHEIRKPISNIRKKRHGRIGNISANSAYC